MRKWLEFLKELSAISIGAVGLVCGYIYAYIKLNLYHPLYIYIYFVCIIIFFIFNSDFMIHHVVQLIYQTKLKKELFNSKQNCRWRTY